MFKKVLHFTIIHFHKLQLNSLIDLTWGHFITLFQKIKRQRETSGPMSPLRATWLTIVYIQQGIASNALPLNHQSKKTTKVILKKLVYTRYVRP